MGDADELNESVARRNFVDERRALEGIAVHRHRSARQLPLGTTPHERANGVPARDQLSDQAAADVAGAAGDENVARHFAGGRHSVITRTGGERSTSFDSSIRKRSPTGSYVAMRSSSSNNSFGSLTDPSA